MKCYHVDAFAERVFEGNPAAVCVMDEWLPDELMQSIAIENNLSETAFTVRENGHWRLRWFTPGGEIDLCGHATLGTAYVLANFVEPDTARFVFDTLSGELVWSAAATCTSWTSPPTTCAPSPSPWRWSRP